MRRAILSLLFPVLIILIAVSISSAQDSTKTNERPQQPAAGAGQRREEKHPPDPSKYSWEFKQPTFLVNHILIEHDALGRGKITFEHKGEDAPIVEPIELSTSALGRIFGLWLDLRFLDSAENYQAAKNFAHLGTYSLHWNDGKRERTAEFNWSDNKDAWKLANEYRHVADQAIFLFDLKVARENQPLNTTTLMNQLESLLNRGELSDPYQLVPLLNDLKTDERIPLIARNHADRILKRIEK
jgi:hypothetical protein